jgi:hypothetical protein
MRGTAWRWYAVPARVHDSPPIQVWVQEVIKRLREPVVDDLIGV